MVHTVNFLRVMCNSPLIFRIHNWLKQTPNAGAVCLVVLVFVLHLIALFRVEDPIYDELGTVLFVNSHNQKDIE